MHHLVLLGDSIFDNAAYTEGGPEVIAQVRARLPGQTRASLLAVDGAMTAQIGEQLARLPSDATHLVLSVGGNDALSRAGLLDMPTASSAQALLLLADAIDEFEAAYRVVIDACMRQGLPLVVCTIYHGAFPDADLQRRIDVCVNLFDDAIVRVATEKRLTVIDLRFVCVQAADYANPIEPSSTGGAKIARAIVNTVFDEARTARRGAYIVDR